MSEFVGLGDADAESRWIGVRRHQASSPRRGSQSAGSLADRLRTQRFAEALVGTLLSRVCEPDERRADARESAYSFLCTSSCDRAGLRFALVHSPESSPSRLAVLVRLHGFELAHRGRLDLSGRDVDNATALASFADALATSEVTRHFSTHVIARGDVVSTMLALPEDVSAPAGWTVHNVLASNCVATHSLEWMLERWAYVRLSDQVIRVLRIRDFSSVPDGHALLERIQFASSRLDVSLHVDVVAGAKAQRVAARAVHRMGSDDLATQRPAFVERRAPIGRWPDSRNVRRSSSTAQRSFASASFSSYARQHSRRFDETSRQ